VSWALVRIDDRLVHGQVVVAWNARIHAKRIMVADDAAAGADWERDLLASAAPGVEVEVVTLARAAERFAEVARSEVPAILLLRDLRGALELTRRGVALGRVNLGGLHFAPGKDRVNDYVFIDAGDRAALREMRAAGVDFEIQDVPASRAFTLAELGLADGA
jgi:mannose/fructose/N-acetylgalactosamine-specific phosphotransferase system component IIB